MTDRILTEREVCELWKVSRNVLHDLRASGELPFIRIGRCVRYRLRDLEEYERENLGRMR